MKKIIKRALTMVLALSLAIVPVNYAKADGEGDTTAPSSNDVYVSFGADLTDTEKATVMTLLGVTQDQLNTYAVGTITNQEEHQYLDTYLSQDVIGNRALSSVIVKKGAAGSGIKVTTNNINYCTPGMYTNALITAGIEDAEVIVAGPFEISGTAALIGAMKAYSYMTGEEISSESMDTAVNEIVLTGSVANSVGDSEKVEELIAYVKTKMIEEGLDNPEDIRAALDEACDALDIELTDDEKEQIVNLMDKINDLDLDVDSIKNQAKDLYDKIKDLNIDTDGIGEKISNFFTDLFDKISNFFSGLFD